MKLALQISYWIACLAIAVFSLMPVDYLPPAAFDVWDKAQHALGFFLLAGLGVLAYPHASKRVFFSLLLFGAAIELTQAATGWRYGDWQDWLANAAGLAVVYSGYFLLCRRV